MTTSTVQQQTTAAEPQRSWRSRWWPFTRHFLEMLLAMGVGMAALHPLWRLALPAALDHDTTTALVMATDMSIGMGAWMRFRGHGWRSVAEMSAAMYVPFVVFFPALWAGGISGAGVLAGGHELMLPAMLGLMLWRRDEYGGHLHGPAQNHP
jgi:flagellar biosynthetic protein FliP